MPQLDDRPCLSAVVPCFDERSTVQQLVKDRFGFEPEVTAKVAAAGVRIFEVGISYSGRTYADGKKIGWRDGVRAVVCIAKYSPIGIRPRRR